MRIMRLYKLIIVLLSFWAFPVFSQNISFIGVTPPKESPFGFITGITQDILGFMWFTSGRVLYRYNGYEFVTYKNNPLDTNSLAGESLICIFADKSGFIWVGDFVHGLDKLDPQTGIFIHYRVKEPAFRFIRFNKLWVGSRQGVEALYPLLSIQVSPFQLPSP